MSDAMMHWFSSEGLMPHRSLLPLAGLVGVLHVVADGLIAVAYASISFALLRFVRKRRDLPFDFEFWIDLLMVTMDEHTRG